MQAVTIYHNPKCGTSRNTLGLIRNTGIEPLIIEYLDTPPDRHTLLDLLSRANLTADELIRKKEPIYHDLCLNRPDISDDVLIDAMLAHPVLINRPIVISSLGVRLCRPSELVLDILPLPQKGAFSKEDGEPVIDNHSQRIE